MHYGICLLCAGLLLLAGGPLAEAAIGRSFYRNDANPGMCSVSDTVILAPGESAKAVNYCARITCENEDGLAVITSCDYQEPLDGCIFGFYKDQEASYPQCCERNLICG
ncbi:uncharacterized protein LOC120773529 [Bactrocera tryoni]|uniref:uncharacterized protein LOC120773529 n=1 Tax=Bactrocera tryoni TaxID=59916 RepID=UPI001A98BAC9|nr:uncharacterized protein LOC120773529 [Bactrocera tryoni]